MKKVKKVKLTLVQRANRKVRELKGYNARLTADMARNTATHENRVLRLSLEIDNAAKAIADKAQTIARRDEVLAQQAAVLRLRDERIVDLTNERNRIVRLVDQFTSVQIVGHGMQVSASIGTSSPDKLRLPVPGLVAAQMEGGQKQAGPQTLPPMIAVTAADLKREAEETYRRKMFGNFR